MASTAVRVESLYVHTSSSVDSLKKDNLYLNRIRCQKVFFFLVGCFAMRNVINLKVRQVY